MSNYPPAPPPPPPPPDGYHQGPPPQGPVASAPPMVIATWATIGAALVCSFLPWANAGFITVSGTDGDGILTLFLSAGAGAFFLALRRTGSRGLGVGAVICACLCAVIYLYDFVDISAAIESNDFITVSPGFGLILGTPTSIAAAVLLIILTVQAQPKSQQG